jgi:hypothetical protein
MSDITNFVFILDRVFSGYPLIGSSFLYSSDKNQSTNLIQHYKGRKIIWVCKAEHAEELYQSNMERYVHEVFILGDYSGPCFKGKKITIVNTNEKALKHKVLCAALRYTQDEEMIQKDLENFGVAERLRKDSIQLLRQIKNLL